MERIPILRIDESVARGQVERDDYVYLRRTALGLRLQPLNTLGRFRLEVLQVTPVTPLAAAVSAVRNKLAALRRYGLVKRALANLREHCEQLSILGSYPMASPST